MNYEQYKAEDFAAETSFIAWVRQPGSACSAFWETWLKNHPEKAEEVSLAKKMVILWQIAQPVPSPNAMTEVWQTIQEQCRETAEEPVGVGNRRVFWQPYSRWAAVFLGLLIFAAAMGWLVNDWRTVRYTTAEGETRSVQLPDGSTVVLNANSSVSLARNWSADQNREVELNGQAFFSVRHLANHRKFVVRTADDVRVEVLGTTFTVAKEPTRTRVVLNSGRVGLYLKNQSQPLLMKPGDLVEVSKDQKETIVRRQVRPEVYSAWKDHQFIFDNTSLAEIAELIESNFGQKVTFADPALKASTITIRSLNRDLDLLLSVLVETHDLTITRRKDHISISHKSLP